MTHRPDSPGRMPATAALLAGGASTRMGRDKASLPWRGGSLGMFTAGRLAGWFEELIISSDRAGVFGGGPFRIVPDVFRGAGALGGIHGSLSASGREWTFVAGCDMPFVLESLVRLLWSLREGWDAVVPESEGGIEPLCAFYSSRCIEPVRAALASGERRIRAFFGDVSTRIVGREEWSRADPEGGSFINVNALREWQDLNDLI